MSGKLTVLCALLVAVYSKALTDDQVEKLMAYSDYCVDQTGVDQDLINKARRGDFTDDDRLKDYLFCMSKKIGFQNEDGDFQMDVVKQKLSDYFEESDIDKLIDQCAVRKGNAQQTAYDSIMCYRENTPERVTLA